MEKIKGGGRCCLKSPGLVWVDSTAPGHDLGLI